METDCRRKSGNRKMSKLVETLIGTPEIATSGTTAVLGLAAHTKRARKEEVTDKAPYPEEQVCQMTPSAKSPEDQEDQLCLDTRERNESIPQLQVAVSQGEHGGRGGRPKETVVPVPRGHARFIVGVKHQGCSLKGCEHCWEYDEKKLPEGKRTIITLKDLG